MMTLFLVYVVFNLFVTAVAGQVARHGVMPLEGAVVYVFVASLIAGPLVVYGFIRELFGDVR